MAKRRKRRGRPAAGHDPVVPVRLPAKLLRDIDSWAAVYRNEHGLVMTRSAAIRCLILAGVHRIGIRAVDPKDQISYEGATRPYLEFLSRPKVEKWLEEGTGRKAKPQPVVTSELGKRVLTEAGVKAAADRAERRSKART